jgi:hypothetical protein
MLLFTIVTDDNRQFALEEETLINSDSVAPAAAGGQ